MLWGRPLLFIFTFFVSQKTVIDLIKSYRHLHLLNRMDSVKSSTEGRKEPMDDSSESSEQNQKQFFERFKVCRV